MRLEEWQKWLDAQFIDEEEASNAAQTAQTVSAHPSIEDPEQSSLAAPFLADSAVVVARAPAAQPPPPVGLLSSPGQTADGFEVPSIERYLPFLQQTEPEPTAKATTPAVAPVELERQSDTEETPETRTGALSAEGHNVESDVTASPELPGITPPPQTENIAVSKVATAPIARKAVASHMEPKRPSTSAYKTAIRRAKHARNVRPTSIVEEMNATTLWSLVPKHLQTLLALGTEEVAQNSYKRGFKESRLELIQRLLDPTLTLEETARLLNVCPTTVRRYTNRGLLTHQRTPGDQRRFKLSDVLAFLEAQSQSTK